MPAASEAVGLPSGGGDVEQEYEIRNDEGFVFKVPSALYPDAAPSSTQPVAGPDPKAAGLRRRRRALLRLRAKRLRDLSRWEALASELLAPLPAPQPPASPPASSRPVAAAASSSSSSASILDVLLAKVDEHADLMKAAQQWCDDASNMCDAHEAANVDSIFALPLWGGDPSEVMAGLCSQDEKTASGNLDEQNGRQEASGVSFAAAKMRKNGVNKQTMGHGLPPPILTESRLRKRVTNLSGPNNVASPASIKPKRKKESGSTSITPGTPGSTARRKAQNALNENLFLGRKKESGSTSTTPGTPGSTARRKAQNALNENLFLGRKKESESTSTTPGTPGSTARTKATSTPASAPDIVCSPGPLTRRRAAAQNVARGSS